VLHPERESRDELERMQKNMGSYAFAAQYQQRPAPLGGGLIKWEWFKSYKKIPARRPGDRVVQSWDTASKAGDMNDWSVCTTWLYQEGRCYLLHVLRKRLEYPQLKRYVQHMNQKFGADLVLIEAVSAGVPLIQELRTVDGLYIVPVIPKDDKATRMMAESPAIEAGRVFVPKDREWLADFQHEIVRFPNGKHDDQVDSLSQFLYWARKQQHPQVPQVTVTLIGGPPPPLSIDDLFNTPMY
jgi:predicted phage terminase large subunit-like protein